MNTFENQVWAYLHDELPSKKREAFENELQSNALLKQQLEEQRSTDLLFKAAYSHADEQVLATELQNDWEVEHPEYKDVPRSGNKIIRISIPLATAAAAAAVLMILQPLIQGPVNWDRTSYGSAPQVRGEVAAQSHYSKKELKQIADTLKQEIETALVAQPSSKSIWTLSIHLQEMAEGSLIIEVSEGLAEDQKIWDATYQDKKEALNEINSFANEISADLSSQ